MGFELGSRRGIYIDISREKKAKQPADEAIPHLEQFDLMYRSLCAMLYQLRSDVRASRRIDILRTLCIRDRFQQPGL